VKAIPMRDLLPTLELLLRQNNAAVVIEEGLYKIVPIAAVRGSVSPQLGGRRRRSRGLLGGRGAAQVRRRARDGEAAAAVRADNSIRVDEVRNLVVMAGTSARSSTSSRPSSSSTSISSRATRSASSRSRAPT
jgi:general secretion pathway protein D